VDFEWGPEEFNWNDYSGEQYRYFVVRSSVDVGPTLFSQASCTGSLRFHQEEWAIRTRSRLPGGSERPITRPSQ
jgi:hypothetical protein